MTQELHAGILIGEFLAQQGVKFLYTLCGGHISPILIGAEANGIRVVDTRHEATAVFAADATARLTGIPGVAAVTAGPGLTNTITALKNAQMAQSPLVLFGGATATLLKGRGALQDIEQMPLVEPHVKYAKAIKKVRDIIPSLREAFRIAQEGVPGPVFLELPVDLLYPESTVRQWSLDTAGKGKDIGSRLFRTYLNFHTSRTFRNAWGKRGGELIESVVPLPTVEQLQKVVDVLKEAKSPVLVVGSQAMLTPDKVDQLQKGLYSLGIPTFLSGMARGLLGRNDLHIRHKRSKALREADVVILAGVPADFRMGYGRTIPRKATYISVNRSKQEMKMNRRPTIGINADAGAFLRMLSANWTEPANKWASWHAQLLGRDAARDAEIAETAKQRTEYANPVSVMQKLEGEIGANSVLIGDGGDFVATASYVVRPRQPLRWLDPGAFGTLGAGGGFALAAQLVYPDAEVWLIYGDGSAGYSIAEFDTFTRHNLPVIAVIGTDASWAQIAREQVEIFGTALGTELARTAYHTVAEGYGAHGILVENDSQVKESIAEAKACRDEGRPVVMNVQIGQTDFRKGSISI